ncbi:MAG TPA: polysaccharide lyase family 7 protein [Streptosporangiaceae bacterium]|nr:polysaccharide lyase family 7 protein [Streptosporangiaceae bacterium]
MKKRLSLVVGVALVGALGAGAFVLGTGGPASADSRAGGTVASSGPSLSGWGLTLPVNSAGQPTGNNAEFLDPAQLDSPWLTRKPNGGLDFWAPAIGATTPHSTHARTELVDNSSFTLGQGPSQTLTETFAVLQQPTQSQNIIVGQLHGGGASSASAYAMLHYRAGEIYVYVAGESSEIDMMNNVPLGGTVAATITASGNNLTFTVTFKGQTATKTVPNTPGFPGQTVRWQAGDYQQDVVAGASQGDGGRVVIYKLQTSQG